jgi:predicted ABC-type ATPase
MASGISAIPVPLPDQILNPDEFARAIDPLSPDRVVVESGRAVLRQRASLLAAGVDFAIETTLSGNSEIRLIRDAKAAGYFVVLIYIATENPKQNLMRIERRRQEQNRSVPTPDVLRRFSRSLAQLHDASSICDEAYIFDNTGQDFVEVMRLRGGRISRCSPNVPEWASVALRSELGQL